jgi:hypothetical protein
MNSELVSVREAITEDPITSLSSSLIGELKLVNLLEETLGSLASNPSSLLEGQVSMINASELVCYAPAAVSLLTHLTNVSAVVQENLRAVSVEVEDNLVGNSSVFHPSTNFETVGDGLGSGFGSLHSNLPHTDILRASAPWRSRVGLSVMTSQSLMNDVQVNDNLVNLISDYASHFVPTSPQPYTVPLPYSTETSVAQLDIVPVYSPSPGIVDTSLIGYYGSVLPRNTLEGSEFSAHILDQALRRSARDEFSSTWRRDSTPLGSNAHDLFLTGAQYAQYPHGPGIGLVSTAHLQRSHEYRDSLGASVPNLWTDLSPLLDMENLRQFPFPILDWERESAPSFLTITSRSASFISQALSTTDITSAATVTSEPGDVDFAQQVREVNVVGYLARRLFRALTVLICW